MPFVYRLQKAKHLATMLSGDGAYRTGGRWNPRGIPLIYTSRTPELAVLESLVHFDGTPIEDLPPYYLVEFEIPDDIEMLSVADLPTDWKQTPVPASIQTLLLAKLNSNDHLAFSVPSVVIPWSSNVLINPLHPDIGLVVEKRRELFEFDQRL